MFRDLVATGRSRWAIFAAKVPGTLCFFVPIVTVAFVVSVVVVVATTGSGYTTQSGLGSTVVPYHQHVPSLALVLRCYGFVLLSCVFSLLLALGLAALITSRAATLAILLGLEIIVFPLLSSISYLGGARVVLFTEAIAWFDPLLSDVGNQDLTVSSTLATVVVLWCWAGLVLGLGAWRTTAALGVISRRRRPATRRRSGGRAPGSSASSPPSSPTARASRGGRGR